MSSQDTSNENLGVAPEIQTTLKEIVSSYENEDLATRELQIRIWRRNYLLWRGFHNIYWDAVSRDWRVPSADDFEKLDIESDPESYNTTINFYRAHGESLIAALSTGELKVRFFPDDAESSDDILTARAKSDASEIIQKQNNAINQQVKILYNLYNYGIAFTYVCSEKNSDYGTFKKSIKTGERQTQDVTHLCPDCGQVLDFQSGIDSPSQAQVNPEESQGPTNNPQEETQEPSPNQEPTLPPSQTMTCPGPDCQKEVQSKVAVIYNTIPIIAEKEIPRTRQIISVYGPLSVKIPVYVKELKNTPYLCLESEQPVSMLRTLYPNLSDKIIGGSTDLLYSRWARLPPEANTERTNLVTVKQWWIRPWAYSTIFANAEDTDLVILKQLYPQGVYFVQLGDNNLIAEIKAECLDDSWESTESPIADNIHADPIGNPYVPIQEMRNDLVSLTIRTIKQGIGTLFADPFVLNFGVFGEHEAEPGMVYPAVPKPGKGLGDAFYATPGATLHEEVGSFTERLDQDGEFVVGDMPGVYGGGDKGGSQTNAEYQTRRNQSLQRLSTYWKMLNAVWCGTMKKAVDNYVKYLKSNQLDESFTQKNGSTFSNVWIKFSELNGKAGHCEPEVNEQYPTTWAAKKGAVNDLMNLKEPPILQTLFSPDNIDFMSRVFGLSELVIPGMNDRDKQLDEIATMVKGDVYVPIDKDLDNNEIHAEVCRNFLISPKGQILSKTNPQAFNLIKQHLMAHRMAQMPAAPQIQPKSGQSQPPQSQPNQVQPPPQQPPQPS